MEKFTNYAYLWIGTTYKSKEEYYKYFEIDYSIENIEDPEYKPCQFCKDIGELWYDEDFVIFPEPFEENVDMQTLLDLAAVDKKEHTKVKKRCKELGITTANAIIYFPGSDDDMLNIPDETILFNGLRYIGYFLDEDQTLRAKS